MVLWGHNYLKLTAESTIVRYVERLLGKKLGKAAFGEVCKALTVDRETAVIPLLLDFSLLRVCSLPRHDGEEMMPSKFVVCVVTRFQKVQVR